MNIKLDVQNAVMCLQALDAAPLHSRSITEISRELGIPYHACQSILIRLEAAGIVRSTGLGGYCLEGPLCERTALEIVQAVCVPVETRPVFKLLYGPAEGSSLQRTLEAAGRRNRVVSMLEG